MAPRQVKPGELITASDWNDLVAALATLDDRVTALASRDSRSLPRITGVMPIGVVVEGAEIVIEGTDFGDYPSERRVSFHNVPASVFSSSDTLLKVKVPGGVADTTRNETPLTMYVGNPYGQTPWPITVKARPQITLDLFSIQAGPADIWTFNEGDSVVYRVALTSKTSDDIRVAIKPIIEIDPAPGSAVPLIPVAVTNDDGTILPDNQINLPGSATKILKLSLTLTTGSTDATVTLKVRADATELASGISSATASVVTKKKVGGPPATKLNDPFITHFHLPKLKPLGTFLPLEANVSDGLNGEIIVILDDKNSPITSELDMIAEFACPDEATYEYHVGAEISGPANGWKVSVRPSSEGPQLIEGDASIDVYFAIEANAEGTAVACLSLKRTGGFTREVKYRLVARKAQKQP